MATDRILDLLRRPVDPDEVAEIRELWKVHSIAEDNRDLPGLISTLTEDCVYTVAGTGVRWEGHEGATRFYTELLTAFPGHPLRSRLHRDRSPGGLRRGDRDCHARGTVARPRAHRQSASSGATRSSSRGIRSRASSRARWSTPTSRFPGRRRSRVDLDVVFLGTSGSAPTAQRATSATLVRRGGDRLLFDCGEGTQRQLLRSDVGLIDLEDVLPDAFPRRPLPRPSGHAEDVRLTWS